MKNVLFFLFFLSQIVAAQTPLLSLNADKGFSGTVWQDQSGNNNHVNLSAATTKTADGVYFNGNINALLTKAIPLSNFTIYMTVKVEALDKTLFGTGISGGYLFHYQTNALYTATAQPFTFFNSNKLVLNQNAVIAFTRNVALNGNNISMYLNGVQIGVFPGTQKTTFNVTNIAGETGFLFKGWIKNICVYNTVHTAATIKLGPPCVTQTVTGAEYLSVKGTSLTDICGNTVVLRGVNVGTHNWGYGPLTSANDIAEIKKTGANVMRLTWYAQPNAQQTSLTLQNLESSINLCVQNQIVPILTLNDLTTNNDPVKFQNIILNWWKKPEVVALIKRHEKHLIVNIANEFGYYTWAGGTQVQKDAFENTYKNAITQLRTAGIRVPLMIDAPDGGSSHQVLLEKGQSLLSTDPLKNIIFSVHTYWATYKFTFDANNNITGLKPNYLSTIQTQVQNIKNSNLCFVLGEVANQGDENGQMCKYDLDDVYKKVLTTAQANNMSWLCWMWYYDQCPNRQMTNNNTFGGLSPYGNDIVNNPIYGLKLTSKPIKVTCP